jgi:hypothetical protein
MLPVVLTVLALIESNPDMPSKLILCKKHSKTPTFIIEEETDPDYDAILQRLKDYELFLKKKIETLIAIKNMNETIKVLERQYNKLLVECNIKD